MFAILSEPDDGFQILIEKSSHNVHISRKPLMCSMGASDHFLHDLSTPRLQWPHAASGQEPHSLVLIAAVKNIHAVARDRVMKCGTGVFGNESEESFPPWVIGVTEQLSPKAL